MIILGLRLAVALVKGGNPKSATTLVDSEDADEDGDGDGGEDYE